MKEQMKRIVRHGLCLVAALVLVAIRPIQAFAYPGTIAGTGNVNVRSQASTGSDAVTSLTGGTTIEIEGEELDSTNQTWYRITVNGTTGYVRADLVNTDGGGNANAGASASDANAGTAATTPVTPATTTTVQERSAKINTDGINVRSGAGRTYNQVTTLALGSEVVVTAEANDADGAKWYKIRFNDNQEGYVYADFLELGEPIAPAEDPAAGATDDPAGGASTDMTATAPVTESPDADVTTGMMGKQYTVSYEMDETGEEVPWLVDNNSNVKYSVVSLINDYEELVRLQSVKKTNTILKIVCAVFAVLTLAAFILLFLASMRFRRIQDGGYEDDDDDDGSDDGYAARRTGYDDDDGDDEDGDYDDDEGEEDDYDDEPPRKKKGGGFFARFRKKDRYEEEDDEEDDEDYDDEDDEDDYDEPPRAIRRVYSPERPSYDEGDGGNVVTPQASRTRPRNFMEDDDDFDYSFMNDD